MNLSSLHPPPGQKHPRKRVGRGMGSGTGKTSTRGHKGQRAVSGFGQKRGFEGGQMPLHRRMPKRGFTNIHRKEYVVVNLGRLAELEGNEFTPENLRTLGVVRNLRDGLKILGEGDLARPITVSAHKFSKSALDKLAAAGGKAEVLGK